MSSKTPVRVVFDGSNNATGLAEFQSGEFVPLSAGGIGASLSIGSAGQVLKVNSGASALEFGNVEAILNIDGLTDGSGITIADGDDFALSDAGTEKKVNASQISTYVQGTISGDITISGGTAAIGSGVIVNADINSSAAIADSKLDTISTAGKVSLSALEIDGGTDIGAALTTSDLIVVDDGAGGTNRKAALSRLVTLMESQIDAIGGNLTITGDLTVNGSTTTVSTTNTVVSDKLFELANGQTGTPSGDIGLVMERGSSDNAFIGFDESADKFIVGTGSFTGATTGNLTVTTGTLVANVEGNLTGNVTGNVSGTAATVTGAAQSNITSVGTLTTLTVDNIIINGTTIGHTDDTDLITFADGIATVAGELSVTTLDIGGTNVTSTAAELNLIDGGATVGTTAVADGDGIIHNDGGTMRVTSAATFKTYFQEGISTAFDDLSAGDAAVNITTTSGNITIDAAANDSDIIFKGTDNSSDITMLTLDGSEAGKATFNDQVVIGDGKLVLNSTAVTSTAAELNIMDGDTSATSTTLVDADRVVVNDAGTMKQVAFSDVTTFINANASFGEQGFTNTTMKILPGNVDFDLAKSNNEGSAESGGFDSSAIDAFGIATGFVFDMLEPVGSSTADNTDLGSSESHVGA